MQPDSGLPTLSPRLPRRQLIGLDCLAAVVYVVALAWANVMAGWRPPSDMVSVPAWAVCLAVAVTGLPLCVRRLRPRLVFAVVLVWTLAWLFLDVARDGFAAAALALYTVATTATRRRWGATSLAGVLSVAAVVVVSVGTPAGSVGGPPEWWQDKVEQVLLGAMALGVAWTIGRAVRERRIYLAHAAAEFAQSAVTEERLRIARELHDVVAHSMSLIAVKASTAGHVFPVRPEAAGEALKVIESSSRSALTEMRHLLGVLRSEPPSAADLAPAPDLSQLPDLAKRAASAGVQVELDTDGLDRLPYGTGLSAYRIVQEAVTNVVRHAAPARCDVMVRAAQGRIWIEVTDNGPGRDATMGAGGGHGLIGMRERVAMYGGEFTAGFGPDGGFQVTASWEYE